ncbi:MAG: prepilin-type N-terminal cleavage/methylation domain-containing protein [Sandaracinaceae bacterium]|nr:prepilin-type N-terminal cleavage/methylation domain-containing protein [Sandaracinaceae bacterium]
MSSAELLALGPTTRRHRVRRARAVAPASAAASGFTLLEVMVAVAILGITLVSIFSSEAGAIRMAGRARLLTTASLLARCKMGEIEEEVLRTGFPAVSSQGSDECCEGGEVEGFSCEWEISRVVIPDQMPASEDEEGEGGGLLGGLLGGAGGAQGAPGAPPAAPPSPAEMLSGSMMAGGGNMISQLAMQFVLPMLKPIIEEQIRRATVTVRWREGEGTQEFDVVQFLVAEQMNAAQMQQALTGMPPQQPPPPQRKP